MEITDYLQSLLYGDDENKNIQPNVKNSDKAFLPIDNFDRNEQIQYRDFDWRGSEPGLPQGFSDPERDGLLRNIALTFSDAFGDYGVKRSVADYRASRSKRDVDYLTALATDYAMKNPGTSGDPNNIANYLKSVSPDVFNRADKRELYANIISENEPIGALPTEVNRRSQAYRDRIAQEVISKNQISFQDPSSGEIVQVMGKDPQSLVEYMRNKGAIVKYDPFDYSYRIVPSDKMDMSMDELEADVMKQANSGNVYVDPNLMKRMFRFGESIDEKRLGVNKLNAENTANKLKNRENELKYRRERDAAKMDYDILNLGVRLKLAGYPGDSDTLIKSLRNGVIPDDLKFLSQENKRDYAATISSIKNIEDDIYSMIKNMSGEIDLDTYDRMNEGELSALYGEEYKPALKSKLNDLKEAKNKLSQLNNSIIVQPSKPKEYTVKKAFKDKSGRQYKVGDKLPLSDAQLKSLKDFVE